MTPLILPDLIARATAPQRLDWRPFRPGVEVVRLHGGDGAGPAAALLRYAPGAAVPRHRHRGFEHVLVLQGAQRDERGVYESGTLAINPPGSAHAVVSDHGCVALLLWEQPPEFEDAG